MESFEQGRLFADIVSFLELISMKAFSRFFSLLFSIAEFKLKIFVGTIYGLSIINETKRRPITVALKLQQRLISNIKY